MIKKFFQRNARVNPEDLNKQTQEVEAKLEREGPRMNAIANYLNWRGDRNGFGEDFEIITLIPRSSQ